MMTMLTKDGIVTPSVVSPEVTLNGSRLNSVNQDAETSSPESVISGLALYRAINNLKQVISDIQVQNKLLSTSIVSSVWSTTTIDPSKGWIIGDSFTVAAGVLSTLDTTFVPSSNTITIPNGRFFALGQYYLHINVLMNTDGFTVRYGNEPAIAVTTEGPVGLIFDVTDQTKTITITVNNPTTGVTFALGEVYLVFVNPTLRDYVETAVDKLFLESVDGLATIIMLNDSAADQRDYTDAAITSHQSASDPHPQYVLRSEASAALQPNRIKTNRVGRKLIDELNPTDIIVNTGYLSHVGDDYDPSSGLISSNTVSDTPLHYAVQVSRSPQTRKTIFNLTNDDPTLRYDFISDVTVSRVTLYLDGLSTTSLVESVLVTVGTHSEIVDIAPYRPAPSVGHVAINVAIPNVSTSSVTVAVVQTSGSPTGTIAIGFAVTYTTAVSGDLVLPSGLVFDACTAPNVVKRFITASDISLSASSLHDTHPYALSLVANNPTSNTTYALTPIPYAPPIVDAFNTDTYNYGLRHLTAASPYYGDVKIVSTNAPVREIYTSKSANVVLNNDTIKHTFVSPLNVGIIRVYLDIPISETETLNVSLRATHSGTSTPYTPEYSVSYATRKVIATFKLQDLTSSEFEIQFTSPNPVIVNHVSVGFRTLYYDAVTNMWSDGVTRVLLGWVTRYGNSRISFTPTLTNDTITMITTAYPNNADYYGRTIRINNPAFTDRISISKHPAIIINDITPEYIEYTQIGGEITTFRIKK